MLISSNTPVVLVIATAAAVDTAVRVVRVRRGTRQAIFDAWYGRPLLAQASACATLILSLYCIAAANGGWLPGEVVGIALALVMASVVWLYWSAPGQDSGTDGDDRDNHAA